MTFGLTREQAASIVAVQAVEAWCEEVAAARRPSIRALKLTGCAFHPARVG